MSIAAQRSGGRARGRTLTFVALAVLATACGKDTSVARIDSTETPDAIALSRNKAPEDWRLAKVGSRFHAGDRFRTGPDAEAILLVQRRARVQVLANTIIHFRPQGQTIGLAVEIGAAEMTVDKDYVFDTEIGSATILAGTRLRLTREDTGNLAFAVLVGEVQLATKAGTTIINGGETRVFDPEIGEVVIKQALPADAGPPPIDAAPTIVDVSVTIKGRRVKARKPSETQFSRLKPGTTTLPPNTSIDIGKASSVAIALGDATATFKGRGSLALVPQPGSLFRILSSGQGTIQSSADTAISGLLQGASFIAEARPGGTSTSFVTSNKRTTMRVRSGAVSITVGDQTHNLVIGESVTITPKGKITITGRAPELVDVAIPAGISATIHDMRGRTAISIRFGDKCPGRGRVEVTSRRTRRAKVRSVAEGDGQATVWAERGANFYKVNCLVDGDPDSKSRIAGRITVHRDAGRARFPKRSTTNRIATDGRTYRVLFQNLIPKFTLTWPKAPQSPSMTLHIKPQRGKLRNITTKGSSHTLSLREGRYKTWFADAATNRRSRTTTIDIRFDNASPTAYIRQPAHNARWGKRIRVAGAALKGSRVSIGGTAVPLDRQHRFDTVVAPPSDRTAIAVRLDHPRSGTHYYLRRRR